MKLLLDTHLLLWSVGIGGGVGRGHLPEEAVTLLEAADEVYFSVSSIWEIAIKTGARKAEFRVDPHMFRRELMDAGYLELAISGEHAAAVAALPQIHKDPFDRILVAQATVEGILLLTADAVLGRYPGPVRRV